MRVEFESTVEEVAETSLVRYRATPAIRRTELGFGVATALLLGAATAARIRDITGLIAGITAATLALLVYRGAAQWLQRRLIRRTWRQHLGEGTVPVVVEAAPHGLVIRYGAGETRTAWSDVREPVEAAGALELRDAEGALLRVPARAFADAAHEAAFRRRISEGMQQVGSAE